MSWGTERYHQEITIFADERSLITGPMLHIGPVPFLRLECDRVLALAAAAAARGAGRRTSARAGDPAHSEGAGASAGLATFPAPAEGAARPAFRHKA